MLQQAAMDAVRQWAYEPYFLDGEPVEATAQINVVFTLRPPSAPIDRSSCSCANYRLGTVAAAGFLDGFRIGNGTTLSRKPVQFSATMMLFSG
jgi:hypothetical protein